MPVTNLNSLIAAMAGSGQITVMNKASISSLVSGQTASLWQSAGLPGAGATPTSAAICSKDLVGAFPLINAAGGKVNYLSRVSFWLQNGVVQQIHDRLAHMAGLSGTVTSAQTVNLDVTGSASNLVARRGAADYSDVRWWIEGYSVLGASPQNLTVTYTNGAGTSGRTVVIPSAVIGGSFRPSRVIEIIGTDREPIRSVQSVQWAANTGTAGNFGVTATRTVASGFQSPAGTNSSMHLGAREIGLPRVENDACLFLLSTPEATFTGVFAGHCLIIEG